MRFFGLGLSIWACLCSAIASAGDGPKQSTAFVHVNVIPMDRERVISDQTVIVEDDMIVAMGHSLEVPDGARVIDGRKTAYLSPGLADMHTHSESPDDLAIYLVNGVTTLLHMGGAAAGFVANTVPAVNRGEIPGPRVYTSFKVDGSGAYNGFVIRSPAEARAIVGLAKTNGYDFLKVYVGLTPDTFSALAGEAQHLGIPVVGHGAYAVRIERQLAEGQVLIAHAEEFFYTFFTPPGVEETDTPPDRGRIASAVALAKRYNAAVTADVGTYAAITRQIGRPGEVAKYLSRPDAVYLSPQASQAWQMSGYARKTAKLGPKLAFLRQLVKAMADADVELVLGTDAPTIPGIPPGFGLHDSLAELEASGLTRFQSLATATRSPGQFIRRTKGGIPFGLVAPGYRADLILSNDNPLATLAALRTPVGVMVGGRWRDATALQTITRDVRERLRRTSNAPCAKVTPVYEDLR